MSGRNPSGESLGVNSRYIVRNGKPWYPIMGEFHYSRYPREYWDDSILKIKSGGVDIIATYVFWIHHEEIEGEYDWSGNRDLRHFLGLCANRGAFILLRIGPWSHGECRNGGFPDWLVQKPIALRSNDEQYLVYVKKHFGEIYRQARGLLFKDDGPIIGIQLENEYGHCGGLTGEEGIAHMKTLKEIARAIGFDVPLYTATGWGGAVIVEGEFVPTMSAYAAAPWTQNTDPLPPNRNYFFSGERDDQQVGSDLVGQRQGKLTYTYEKNPYLLAELGAGIQVTRHRRPIVTAKDTESLALVKLGSGANLLGYYMYHGGSNPVGKLSTLQESRDSGSPNDLPVLSYDFQTAVREFGQISDTYRYLKTLHLFLHDFGDRVAETTALIPESSSPSFHTHCGVRFALRVKDDSGFLFVNHHQRRQELSKIEGVNFILKTRKAIVRFPEFDLINGLYFIFPFNLPIHGITLQNASAQLLCKTDHKGEHYFFFFSYPEIPPVYVFRRETIGGISAIRAAITNEKHTISVAVTEPGTDATILLRDRNGRHVNIITLTRAQAERCWKGVAWGRERIFLANGELQFMDKAMRHTSDENRKLDFSVFPAPELPVSAGGLNCSIESNGLFTPYRIEQDFASIPIQVIPSDSSTEFVGEWEIRIPDIESKNMVDLFLVVDFVGDKAELYLGDRLAADCFYNGLLWEIGLKRFKARLHFKSMRLRIHALIPSNPVYLEKKCEFTNGRALRLRSVHAWPQYSVEIWSGLSPADSEGGNDSQN